MRLGGDLKMSSRRQDAARTRRQGSGQSLGNQWPSSFVRLCQTKKYKKNYEAGNGNHKGMGVGLRSKPDWRAAQSTLVGWGGAAFNDNKKTNHEDGRQQPGNFCSR
jgi:hypothetical protein